MVVLDKIRKPFGRLVEPSFKARGVKIYFWLRGNLDEDKQVVCRRKFVDFLSRFFEDTTVYFYNDYPKRGTTEAKIIGLKPRFKVKESNAKSTYLEIEKQTVGMAAYFFYGFSIINYDFQIAFGIIPPEDQNIKSLVSEYSNMTPQAAKAAIAHSLENKDEILWSCGGIPAHERPKIKLPQPIKNDLIPLNMIIPLE